MCYVITVLRTNVYDAWVKSLADAVAVAKITTRIDRMQEGNFGNVAAVGEGVSELKIDFGPGYRVYFVRTGKVVVLLLCGGDKSSQKRDIRLALQMAAEMKKSAKAKEG